MIKILTLNLDPGFKLSGYDELKYESFFFSGGEFHIKNVNLTTDIEEVIITHRCQSGDNIMQILLQVILY